MGQVERVWSHEVLAQEAAEQLHETKPRSEDRGKQMGAEGEGHPGQARLQGPIGRAGVSRRQGLHQIARRFLHEALSCSPRRLGLQRV